MSVGALVGGLATGCAEDATPTATASAALEAGLPPVLPGTDPVAFEAAAELFAEEEFDVDGLGPVFNGTACGVCHDQPFVGGSGEQIERRFGRISAGRFFAYDRAPDDQGGTLRQLFANSLTVLDSGGQPVTCVPTEVEPLDANVNGVGRRTTPLFGLGLVDAMPDAWFDLLAAIQPASVRGRVRRVPVVLPDPRDPTQRIGSTRVGRFGWKAEVPSLLFFSGDAYLNEMGITTQSCFGGQSVLAFAYEVYPNQLDPSSIDAACGDGDLATPNPAGVPDVPVYTDDAVGPCDGGRTEIQDDLLAFTFFMERLAPPARDLSDPTGALLGAVQFARVGCATCHTPLPFVTPARPTNGVPGSYVFQPYSDFLVHDMGALGDRIGATGDSEASTRGMRTAPLWGARLQSQFLHDGRALTIRDAIVAHDGQGAAARNAFLALRPAAQDQLVRFVRSL